MSEVNKLVHGLKLISKGKVWECYEIPNHPNLMLKVATDNISTHNIVHSSTIPRKGEVLTAMSIMFAKRILNPNGIRNHMIAYSNRIWDYLNDESQCFSFPNDFERRSMIVQKLEMIPYEFIFRGYMMGSLWDKYVSRGIDNPYGLTFSRDIKLMSKLTPCIFTPTDKSETDEPQDAEAVKKLYFKPTLLSLKVYKLAREFVGVEGIDIIDTKFELGLDGEGNIILADEWLTPDSSRYVAVSEVKEGVMPAWLDKQIARDYVQWFWKNMTEEGKCPVDLPNDVVSKLTETYVDLFETIFGETIDCFWNGT